MLIKSKEALSWMKAAKMQIPASAKVGAGSPEQTLAITFWVRYASRRPDLSVELILDTLQKAGVIADDRYVFETHAFKEIDKSNPGVDILIEESELC
jgi:Holliday junction resolvase RusA-like endonuclease